MPNGWIGSHRQLMNVLATYGVDKDEEGNYLVSGEISSFMGAGEEMVVGEDAKAYVGGRPQALIPMLHSTSYGLQITVIGGTE